MEKRGTACGFARRGPARSRWSFSVSEDGGVRLKRQRRARRIFNSAEARTTCGSSRRRGAWSTWAAAPCNGVEERPDLVLSTVARAVENPVDSLCPSELTKNRGGRDELRRAISAAWRREI
jgi:hypothetical protein